MTEACSVEGCSRDHLPRHELCRAHRVYQVRTGVWPSKPLRGYRVAPEIRFREKYEVVGSGCWLWRAKLNASGYGTFGITEGNTVLAHRFAYELLIGPIPQGLQLDHLCRVRACCNPAHLEPVTNFENLHRGFSIAAMNARKTHCKRGHEFSPENTHLSAGKHGRPVRHCRACRSQKKAA